MRLLIFTQYFEPENFRINDLVAGLRERGHEITVLTGQPNYPEGKFYPGYAWNKPQTETIFGSSVVRVWTVSRGKGSSIRLFINYISYALFASMAVLSRIKNEYDAIFVFQVSPVTVCIPALLASNRFNLPVIMWVLDLWPQSLQATKAVQSPLLLNFIARIVKHIYNGCSKVLVQSQEFIPIINMMDIPLSKIYYFPNWVEPYYSSKTTPTVINSNSGNNFTIVYAGNIGVAQDFPAILDAAELLFSTNTTIRFVIAGDGRMSSWVKHEVNQRNLSNYFEFLGQIPSKNMHDLFLKANVLLLALRKDPTLAATIPGKLQSYMASGQPIIGMVDGEACRVIRESGCGFSVKSGDSASLVKAILDMYKLSVNERRLMGQLGKAYADREFNRDYLLNRLENWLLEETANKFDSGF